MTLSSGFAFKFAFAAARLYPWRCFCGCRDRSSTHRLSLHTASLSARSSSLSSRKGSKLEGIRVSKSTSRHFDRCFSCFFRWFPSAPPMRPPPGLLPTSWPRHEGTPIEAATRLATNACQLLRAAGVFTCELAVRCRCPRRSSNFELQRASIPQCWRGRFCSRSWSLTSDCIRSTILHTSRPSLGCIFEDLRAPAWSACSADFVTSPCLACMAHDASEVSHGAPNGLRDGVRASQGTARKEVDGRPKTVTAPARSFEQKWLRMR